VPVRNHEVGDQNCLAWLNRRALHSDPAGELSPRRILKLKQTSARQAVAVDYGNVPAPGFARNQTGDCLAVLDALAPWVLSTAPRHAHLTGFDLHANVAVPAADRARLEHLCRYLLRPAVAQGRLRLLDDGRIVLIVKTAWADGTRHLVFEPLTLLDKLAALTPRPRINLVLYHGVLAPNAAWRARVVSYGAPPGEAPVAASVSANVNADPAALKPRHWAWANLMRRAFDIDVLACPQCRGRLRLIATVEDPNATRAILAALATSRERPDRAPPYAPVPAISHVRNPLTARLSARCLGAER
jgi:hypothetical protein